MSQRRSTTRKPAVQHAGRVTITECRARGGGRPCAPVNRLTVYGPDGRTREFCTCSCGRRFKANDPDAASHLLPPIGPPEGPDEAGASETWTIGEVLPDDVESKRAATGIVPIGTTVLHEPTRRVGAITADIKALAKHMIKVMLHAPGVGVAANQVGVPLRMFVHIHKKAAPECLVDPEIRAVEGSWKSTEGCLSVRVPETSAPVTRPRRIQVRARTVHGEVVEVTVDELVARVFQHEIDHLDGIAYLQRLTGTDHQRVYGVLESEGVDTRCVPPCPY